MLMSTFRLTILFTLMLFATNVFAQAPVPVDEPEIGLSFSYSDTHNSLGGSVAAPFDTVGFNGFASLQGHRTSVDGELVAKDFTLYAEGGTPINSFELSLFTRFEDHNRLLGLQKDFGYFVELPKYQKDSFTMHAGLGNFTRHRIEEIDADAETSFNWKAFVRLVHDGGFAVQFQVNTGLKFEAPEFLVTPSISYELADTASIDFTAKLVHSGETLHTTTSAVLKKTF